MLDALSLDASKERWTVYGGFVPESAGYGSLAGASLVGLNRTLQNLIAGGYFDDSGKWVDSVVAHKTIECHLYNASYTVNFTFHNSQQNVTGTNLTLLEGIKGISARPQESHSPPSLAAAIVYTSMFIAFNDLLLGSLAATILSTITAIDTQITRTVLMETIEMQYLYGSRIPIYEASPLSIANMIMAEALEQIFLNTTLSLFSDSYFL
ncbi:hypothetical protein GQ53DRAFT_828895 [Thozetella sp. PMI_491]|nr:hypothetical protein GQ53DRAFT_828895 [Thozetella sp. PMI_491]